MQDVKGSATKLHAQPSVAHLVTSATVNTCLEAPAGRARASFPALDVASYKELQQAEQLFAGSNLGHVLYGL